MDTPKLTPRERAVFDFVYDELAEGRPSPSLVEIAEEFDFHRTNAWRLVTSLLNKGVLEREGRRHRTLRVTREGRALRRTDEAELRARRGPVTVSPVAARVLASIRVELGRLRARDRAVVLERLSAG